MQAAKQQYFATQISAASRIKPACRAGCARLRNRAGQQSCVPAVPACTADGTRM